MANRMGRCLQMIVKLNNYNMTQILCMCVCIHVWMFVFVGPYSGIYNVGMIERFSQYAVSSDVEEQYTIFEWGN